MGTQLRKEDRARRRPPVERLAALGAVAVSFGLAALFALFVYFSAPRSTGGMNGAMAAVSWISVGGVVLALIAVHLVFARLLMDAARAAVGRCA